MAYRIRLLSLILLDSIIVSTAIFIAAWIAYPYETVIDNTSLIISAMALLVFHHIFAIMFNLYNKVWAYASISELIAIVKAITLSIIGAAIVQFFVSDFTIYKRALLVTWMLHILMIGGSRFIWRIFRDGFIHADLDRKKTLIIGAGSAGAMIARQLITENNSNLLPVGFVDDNNAKQKMELYNLPILGQTRDIAHIVEKHAIEHIIIAIPSLKREQLNEIVSLCHKTEVKTQILPKVEDLLTGKISVTHLKDVEVEDLLGRDLVKLDIKAIKSSVSDRTIMVTGAGGSIGSELCRQLVKFMPKRIVLVGHGEYSIYKIDRNLTELCAETNIEIIPIIADIKDRKRIFSIVEQFKPIVIYHAAAHKHVPLMEVNPHEAVKNNIIGTKNVAEAAHTFDIHTFVLVSTDKAVNPTSVMGATKRLAEIVLQHLSKESETIFTAVRFGNVLGSRGSVIPLFKEQIAKGGPVTVTDPKMTRYFMTIEEASRLVIQASMLANGGEVFVLDMGEPVKIVDLAKKLIKLSGYSKSEIPIVYTGIRPGEKLYEEIMNESELLPGQVYEKIYVGRTSEFNEELLFDVIHNFENYNIEQLKTLLIDIVHNKSLLIKVHD